MKNFKLLYLLALCMPLIFYSQYKINGRVLNTEKSPVKSIEIFFSGKNQNEDKKVTTNENGSFVAELTKGSYSLIIKDSEYKYFEKAINVDSDMKIGDIELQSLSKMIEEVKLTSSPKMVVQKIDRMVFNVENNALVNKGNIFESLKMVPGLVLKNDQIAMLGRDAVKVMIDGRMINLSGDDIKNFLRSIPSENIKSVEIISNPPARYEAEGNSGIINLVLKKVKNNSWSNSMTLSQDVAKAKYVLRGASNSFTYQKNKISFLSNLRYDYGDIFVNQRLNTYFSEPYLSDSGQKWNYNQLFGRFLVDYELSSKTKFGVQYQGSVNNNYVDDYISTTVTDSNLTPKFFLNGDGHTQDKNTSHLLNFHLEQKLDTIGRKFSIDLDYLSYNTDRGNTILSNKYDTGNNFKGVNFFNQAISDQMINNYNAKFDIDHPGQLVNLSFGGKFTFTDTNYQLDNYDLLANSALQSNKFKFNEDIQALYINGTRKFSDKWELQAGLRAEYTQTKGYSVLINQTDYNKYLQLFPSLFVKYDMNDKNSLVLSYARRIQRPSYGQMNPARFYTNSQTSSMGNPYLKPSYVDNVELSHTYKNLTSKLAFNINSNAFDVIFKSNEATKELISTYDNYYRSYGYSVTESYDFKTFSWWKTYVTLFMNYSYSQNIKDYNLLMRNGFEFFGSLNNSFNLNHSKTLTADLNFWYGSPFNRNAYHYSKGNSLDAAISYKTPYKGLNLSFAVYDIFNSSPRMMTSELNGIVQTYVSYTNNRFFRLSVNYSFGNDKITKKERGFGNEDEVGRSR